MQPYPKYKPTNIPWISQIPIKWKTIKTKYLFQLITQQAPENNDYELLSVYTDIGVKPRKELEARGNKASTTDFYWKVKSGDIIVNKLLAWMGAIGLSEYNGVTSPAYDVLRKIKPINEHFYNYLFRSGLCLTEFKKRSKGIMEMRNRLYFDEFGQILLPVPPLEEQNAIVNFLNSKISEIDTFIANKKKIIELLDEKKKAIINHAVTKGINPKVKLKPSGIDWLGEIPEHWEIKRLKKIVNLKSGYSIDSENINPVGEYPVLGGNGLRGYTNTYTNEGQHILIGRQGALCGNINLVECKFYATEHAVVVTILDQSEMVWLAELLRTMNLNQYSQAAAQPGLSVDAIKNLSIPYPPYEEQKEISSVVNNENENLNYTITKIKKEIDLIQEYKTTLISDVVTGKIRVPMDEFGEITDSFKRVC